MIKTIKPNTLIVASAYPDPPFDIISNNETTGFDVELMRAICAQLKLSLQTVKYTGEDFNGIFNGLITGEFDAVISGTTITAERSAIVLFSKPYLEFNQGVAINTQLTSGVSSMADLRGLVAGIQKGNTSDIVAKKLLSDGIIKDIHYYPYNKIGVALEDLNEGKIGLIIKLFPVLSYLVRPYPKLSVALQAPTHEKLGIAFAKNNQSLCDAINEMIDTLKSNGTFTKLKNQWLPN